MNEDNMQANAKATSDMNEAAALMAVLNVVSALVRQNKRHINDGDLDGLKEGLAIIDLMCCSHMDLESPDEFSLISQYVDDLSTVVITEWARRKLADGHKLLVTDECGEFRALITGLAEYRCPYGGNPAYKADYPDVVEPRGFRVLHASGREEITEFLSNAEENYYGVGNGPWDGQFHTIELYDEQATRVPPMALAAARGMQIVRADA